MTFSPVRQLEVWRTQGDGREWRVGRMAQNAQGVFFQYDSDYLASGHSLSLFQLEFTGTLQRADNAFHGGLFGVFADSLPDGWGLLLQDKSFRQAGILPSEITAMDRLAFVGDKGSGALSYRPASPLQPRGDTSLNLLALGEQAERLFNNQTGQVLANLVAVGSSGGARPKAQVYFSNNRFDQCHLSAQAGDSAWLVKFTSQNLPLSHEEGRCEAVWLTLAKQAGIDTQEWTLLPATPKGDAHWLALKRFDRVLLPNGGLGHYHLHSACALLNADFREPSLDYADLIKAGSMLCKSPYTGQQLFRRALFNLLAVNQDDHSKNWAFRQDDQGQWTLAPFYDVTFSPHPFGEHATSFNGYGKQPPLKAIQQLATTANFASWTQAKEVVEAIMESLTHFRQIAKELGVKRDTIGLIEKRLNLAWRENKGVVNG